MKEKQNERIEWREGARKSILYKGAEGRQNDRMGLKESKRALRLWTTKTFTPITASGGHYVETCSASGLHRLV